MAVHATSVQVNCCRAASRSSTTVAPARDLGPRVEFGRPVLRRPAVQRRGCTLPTTPRTRLLHLVDGRHADAEPWPHCHIARASSSNATINRRARWLVDRQLVVSTPQLLNQRMPTDHDPGAMVLVEAAHRSKPCLQAAMVGLDAVVGVPIRAVPHPRQQLLKHHRVGCRTVSDHLDRPDASHADGPLEEPTSGVASHRRETNTSMTWPAWSIAW